MTHHQPHHQPQQQQQFGQFQQQQGQPGQQGQQNLLDDQTIAAQLLSAAKTSVKDLAAAITEAVTPGVRQTLQSHLNEAIQFQHQVADFVVQKGWYKPYDIQSQIQMDVQSSQQKIQNIQSVVQ